MDKKQLKDMLLVHSTLSLLEFVDTSLLQEDLAFYNHNHKIIDSPVWHKYKQSQKDELDIQDIERDLNEDKITLQTLHRALFQYGKKHPDMVIRDTEFAQNNFKFSDTVEKRISNVETDLTQAKAAYIKSQSDLINEILGL